MLEFISQLCVVCQLKIMSTNILLVFLLLLANVWILVHPLRITTRMLGGGEASPGQFPFIAAIQYRYTYPSGHIIYAHFCVGSILSNHWIISSADCLRNQRPYLFYVVTGLHYIQNDGIKYKVDNIVIHPDYHGLDNYYKNDIALVKTRDPIEFFANVRPIGISTVNTNGADGIPVQVTGWDLERSPVVNNKQMLYFIIK